MPNKKIFIAILMMLYFPSLFAQGCSDAGFCTIDYYEKQEAQKNNALKMGFSLGKSDHGVFVQGLDVEYGRKFNDKWGMQLKINQLRQSGNGISAWGMSDLLAIFQYRAWQKLKITAGAKIPFSDGNATHEGVSLPMEYQSSLGTLDFIIGMGYSLKKWNFSLAYQQPITQNKNAFQQEILPKIPATNGFKRSGDVLFKSAYRMEWKEKWNIHLGGLFIYHIQNDTRLNALNNREEIQGSKGLTINGTAQVKYALRTNHSLHLNMGVPFKFRTSRPDGLTRIFMLHFQYVVQF